VLPEAIGGSGFSLSLWNAPEIASYAVTEAFPPPSGELYPLHQLLLLHRQMIIGMQSPLAIRLNRVLPVSLLDYQKIYS
jgi:hypothetical protein